MNLKHLYVKHEGVDLRIIIKTSMKVKWNVKIRMNKT